MSKVPPQLFVIGVTKIFTFVVVIVVVDHAILLGKLQTLGIDQFALNWIVSFLS